MTVLDGIIQEPFELLTCTYDTEEFWKRCKNILDSFGRITIGDLYFLGSVEKIQDTLRKIEEKYEKEGAFLVPSAMNPEEVRF